MSLLSGWIWLKPVFSPGLRIRICINPYYFGKLATGPHQIEKLDPYLDPRESQNSGAVKAQKQSTMKSHGRSQ
jgi:hypothetical protein